jgi:hypothetical protein
MMKNVLTVIPILACMGLTPIAAHADVGGSIETSAEPAAKQTGVWSALAGSTLKTTLEGWTRVSGWTLVWDTPYDYEMDASATFQDDFMNSVGRLVDVVHQKNPDVNAVLYKGNRVIYVTSDELTSD